MDSIFQQQQQEYKPNLSMDNQKKTSELKMKKRETDNRITDLVDKYIEAEATLGVDHFQTQLYATTLELVVPLKEMTNMLLGVNDAMSVLRDSIGLIDEILVTVYGMFENQGVSYGFFTRIKNRRKLKRFTKNFNARMTQVFDMVGGISTLTSEMRKQIEKMSLKMHASTLKNQKKAQKANERRKAQPQGIDKTAGGFISAQAMTLINERKKEKGGDSTPTPPSTAPTAPSSSGTDSIDDIV